MSKSINNLPEGSAINKSAGQQFSSRFVSKCGATFTCRKCRAFRLHKRWSLATNIKPLQSAKMVILHHFWECMRIWLMHLVSWHARLGMTEWQLHVLVASRSLLLRMWEKCWWRKLHLVHSHAKWLRRAHHFSGCHLEPLNFLLQCFIQSCMMSPTNFI